VVLTAALSLVLDSSPARPAYADTFSFGWDVQFCDAAYEIPGDVAAQCETTNGSSLINAAKPTYVIRLAVQTEGGAPQHPLLDEARITWPGELQVCPGASECGGQAAPEIGAIIAQAKFSSETNISIWSNNIDPATGAPPACGAPNTLSVPATVADLLYAKRTWSGAVDMSNTSQFRGVGAYVQSFDDDDGDLVEFYAPDPGDDGSGPANYQPETQGRRHRFEQRWAVQRGG